jgi:putative ABC transport system permease protein
VAAVLLLFRRELRRRWRSTVFLAVLVGLLGAVVLATAAGAHRSGTALSRFVAYSRSSDVEVDVRDASPARLAAFRRVPQVADFAVLHAYGLTPRGRPALNNAASVDGRLGILVDRARLVRGRFANPADPNETMIGEGLAAQQHLGIGDFFEADSITPAQMAKTFRNQDPGPPAGPRIRLKIVGIYRRPLDLGNLASQGGVVIETPAFDRALRGRVALFTTVLRVRARHGEADVPAVTAAATRIFGPQTTAKDVTGEARGGADAINVLTLALWVFAAISALAGGVALAIVLSRDVAQSEMQQVTLSALGLTRRECFLAVVLRVFVVLGGGLVLAAVGAIAASPVFPIGIARRADPSPGVRVDLPVLGLGLLGIAVFVTIVGLIAAARWSRGAVPARGTQRTRATLADAIARAGIRPTLSNGLRMALDPGQGASAIPVRSAFFGAVFGVAGLTAALVFGASLAHLDTSPHLYGWTWDFKAPDNTQTVACDANDYGLSKVDGVAADAAVCFQTGTLIDGRPTNAWAFTDIHGSIQPEVVAGRAATGRDEVALGATALRALHKHIGDTVTARGAKGSATYHVVGQIVLPPLEDGEIQPLADGAAFTGAGFAPVLDTYQHTRYLVGTLTPGRDHATVLRAVGKIPAFSGPPGQEAFETERGATGVTRPPEVDRVRAIRWFPEVLALVILLLALVAVGHALVTTSRRRRADLALLKTFGFVRRQVRATLAWQATVLAAVGLVLGIPAGIAVGHLVWKALADNLGIVDAVILPFAAIAITVPAVVVLLNAVAYLPARSAARTWPAAALVTE